MSVFTTYATAEIRAEMARQRIYNKDLAAKIGVTAPTMSRYLSGRIPLTLDDLERIAEALGVSLWRFIPAADLAATGTGGGPTPQVLARPTRTNRQKAGTPRNGMSAQSRPGCGQSPDQAVTRLDSYRIRAA
jgi:transcriptional regulator with XRE-family HTH domain